MGRKVLTLARRACIRPIHAKALAAVLWFWVLGEQLTGLTKLSLILHHRQAGSQPWAMSAAGKVGSFWHASSYVAGRHAAGPARRFFFPRHRSTLLARLLLLLLAAAIAAAPSFAAGGVTAGVHCTVQHVAFMPHADTLSSISCPCTADLAAVRGAPYRRTVPVGQGPASVTIYEHRCQCHTKDRIDRLIHKQGIVPDGQRQGTARHGTRCTGASRRVVV
jgi:hypothetical protein